VLLLTSCSMNISRPKVILLPKEKTIVAEVFLKLCAKTKIILPEKVFIC
jgi:hypothetical protein